MTISQQSFESQPTGAEARLVNAKNPVLVPFLELYCTWLPLKAYAACAPALGSVQTHLVRLPRLERARTDVGVQALALWFTKGEYNVEEPGGITEISPARNSASVMNTLSCVFVTHLVSVK